MPSFRSVSWSGKPVAARPCESWKRRRAASKSLLPASEESSPRLRRASAIAPAESGAMSCAGEAARGGCPGSLGGVRVRALGRRVGASGGLGVAGVATLSVWEQAKRSPNRKVRGYRMPPLPMRRARRGLGFRVWGRQLLKGLRQSHHEGIPEDARDGSPDVELRAVEGPVQRNDGDEGVSLGHPVRK